MYVRCRSAGKAIGGAESARGLNACLKLAVDSVLKLQKGPEKSSENERRKDVVRMSSEEGENAKEMETKDVAAGEGANELKTEQKQVIINTRLHCEAFEALNVVQTNKTLWSLLAVPLQRQLLEIRETFCPITYRYYESVDLMFESREESLLYSPALRNRYPSSSLSLSGERESENVSNDRYAACIAGFGASAQERLKTLLPPAFFAEMREEIRSRLNYALSVSGILPVTVELNIFGSSQNNFGSDGADCDMCISYPGCELVNREEKAVLIEAIGDFLCEELGMLNVSTRTTSRIPIVMFKDPKTLLDCDISFYNPLALSNTSLLRTYSCIDSRLREVAFIVKKWVKARHINSPLDGTLSSYGYILMVIHFFQTRAPPIIPSLQRLPTTWSGHAIHLNSPPVDEHEWQVHPVEGCKCDTYFYRPQNEAAETQLKEFASKNTLSTAELLMDFFRYYAWDFDYRRSVISVRNGSTVSKLSKSEDDCWLTHTRLSIEDPFESWYDVAHVVKNAQMKMIRNEFIRAHTLISRCINPVSKDDALPGFVRPEELLDLILEEGNEEFERRNEEKRSRGNTLTESTTDQK